MFDDLLKGEKVMKMKRSLAWLFAVVVFCYFLSLNVLAQDTIMAYEKYEPITKQLITMVEHNSELKKLLIKSIEMAKSKNPDRTTNPAQTLEEYYGFVDWAAKTMPWTILPDLPYPKLYEQIDQSLDYFYFINDQPLNELKGKEYYNNSLQYHEPYRTWLINFTKEWGMYLSTEGSWNEYYDRKALADDRFGLEKGWYEDPSNWKTFNDFFTRYLKSPDQRPIADPDDWRIVTAPADSTPQGVWKIDNDSNIVSNEGVTIKSNVFKSVKVLIGEGSAYRDAFATGTLTHTFLDVNDYHRYHFPIGGKIKEARIIEADDAAGGITIWDPEKKKYILESTEPGWQNIETRGCVIIENEKYGLVALLPIGMSQISSVNFEDSVKEGYEAKKGDMLGYFLFGGSDFVLLFRRNVDFKLTVKKIHEGDKKNDKYQHILMGEKYGELSLKE